LAISTYLNPSTMVSGNQPAKSAKRLTRQPLGKYCTQELRGEISLEPKLLGNPNIYWKIIPILIIIGISGCINNSSINLKNIPTNSFTDISAFTSTPNKIAYGEGKEIIIRNVEYRTYEKSGRIESSSLLVFFTDTNHIYYQNSSLWLRDTDNVYIIDNDGYRIKRFACGGWDNEIISLSYRYSETSKKLKLDWSGTIYELPPPTINIIVLPTDTLVSTNTIIPIDLDNPPFPELYPGVKWDYFGITFKTININNEMKNLPGKLFRTKYSGKVRELLNSILVEEYKKIGWRYYYEIGNETTIYFHEGGWFMEVTTSSCKEYLSLMCTTIWESTQTNQEILTTPKS
jgi:hypothetical protein